MSYSFDVMRRVFVENIRARIPATAEVDNVCDAFEDLIEAMHSANHQVPSPDGVFKGDGINKAANVERAARRLEDVVSGRGF